MAWTRTRARVEEFTHLKKTFVPIVTNNSEEKLFVKRIALRSKNVEKPDLKVCW